MYHSSNLNNKIKILKSEI